MDEIRVSKSEFKAKALEYFRVVEVSGKSVVVTDHDKPRCELRPYRNTDRRPLEILRGSVLRYLDPTIPAKVEWDSMP